MALDRFKWWAILFVSSFVLLFSFLERDQSGVERITNTVFPSISIIVSGCGIFASILPRRVLIFRLESVLIWVSVVFWGSVATFTNVLPINTDSSIEINVIPFPNQFFFSYLCLIASVVLLASWFKKEVQSADTLSTQFVLLSASSFLVMVAGIGFRDRRLEIQVPEQPNNVTNITLISSNTTVEPPDNDPFNFAQPNMTDDANNNNNTTIIRTSFCEATEAFSCARVEFAIVMGAFSAGIALAVALSSKSCLPVKGVVDISLILFVAWCCSIAFLTFHNGPGFSLGTIFFASYISLFLCLDILVKSLNQQSALDRHQEAVRNDDFRERLNNDLRNGANVAEAFAQVSVDDFSDKPSLELHLGGSGKEDSDDFIDAFETLPPSESQIEPEVYLEPEQQPDPEAIEPESEPEQEQASSTTFGRRRGRRKTLRRKSHHRRLSKQKKNYRNMSGSIFESVGAWRGTSIYNLDGQRIPSEVANPSGIGDDKIAVEEGDILRLELWMILCISSIVCLVAIVQVLPGFDGRDPIEDVAIAMPSISIFISAAGVIACGKRDRISKWIEFSLIVVAISCWVVSLVCRSSFVDLSGREISTGTVASANIFCASWGSFVVSIALACAWLRMSLEMVDFAFLAVFGAALTASSFLFYREEISLEIDGVQVEGRVCKVLSSVFSCMRVRYGMYLGICTAVLSILVLLLEQKIKPKIRLMLGLLLFVSWSCATGYLTFGRGHGSFAGSIYLEVWVSFFLSMDIMNTNVVSLLRSYYGEDVEEEEPLDQVQPEEVQSKPNVAGEEKKEPTITFKLESSDDPLDDEQPDPGEDGVALSSWL